MDAAFTMEGPLSKWTNVVNGWQYRWFVLDFNMGILFYYTSKEKMMKGDRRGCVKLKNAQVGIDDEDDSTFTITVDHKTFHFQARDSNERQKWLDALQEARDLHTHNYALLHHVSHRGSKRFIFAPLFTYTLTWSSVFKVGICEFRIDLLFPPCPWWYSTVLFAYPCSSADCGVQFYTIVCYCVAR
ncbi:unnamed protein product [Dicrocoelium dendriticum]|nr:unnamed protein product [Dicrocoelium dendriticum]